MALIRSYTILSLLSSKLVRQFVYCLLAQAVLYLSLQLRTWIFGRPVGPCKYAQVVRGGWEAAVHAVRQLYRDPNLQTILLVDASNAFNSVNRRAALHNIL